MTRYRQHIIGVLHGGLSRERPISLKSGQAILEALLQRGYSAVPIDVGPDLVSQLQEKNIQVAFLALHGRYGEDGYSGAEAQQGERPFARTVTLAERTPLGIACRGERVFIR